MCSVYFVVTIIQFQSPYYFEQILHFDKTLITVMYLVNSVVILSLGVLIGGKITNFLGGIRALNTVKFMLFLMIGTSVSGVLFSTSDNVWVVGIFMGLTLFFGAGWLPISMTMNIE